MTGRYDFAVTPESTYARAASMVDCHAGPGVVVDLGCSYGRIAEVIAGAGRTYIGIDVDDDARASLSERGHESHRLDLGADDLARRLAEIVGGRQVSAVLALDVIEHLATPSALLGSLATLFAGWGDPLLVVSVPNVAHRDLAVKLLAGRWDVTETGLLDRTHLSLFTEQRLITEMGAQGFRSVDVDDVIMSTAADQIVPGGHPFLAGGTPLADLVSWLRSLPDGRGDTFQFVWALRRTAPVGTEPTNPEPTDAEPTDHGRSADAPDLTVIIGSWSLLMASRAGRARDGLDGLGDTLACLAAQDTERFEVLIPAQPTETDELNHIVEGRAGSLGQRVRLIPGGNDPATQFNVCLGAAGGALVAPLAAGDIITDSWVRCFVEGSAAHPGAVVRARSVLCPTATVGEITESLAKGVAVADEHFDLWRHLSADQLPFGSFALPVSLCRHGGLHLDDQAPAPSWRFTFLAAMLAGVADRDDTTCIHRRPAGEPVASAEDLAAALVDVPIFLPAGWIGRLQGDRNHLAYLTGELQATKDRLESVTRAHDSISASRFWRVTGPARRGAGWWRSYRSQRA